MDAVFHAPGDQLIQIPQLVFVDQAAIFWVVREAQGGETEKDPCKIEAVVGQELDVRLPEVGASGADALIFTAAQAYTLPVGRQLGLGDFRQVGIGVQQVIGDDGLVVAPHVRQLHVRSLRLQDSRIRFTQTQHGTDGFLPGQRILEVSGLPFKIIGIDSLAADSGDQDSAGGDTAPHIVAVAPLEPYFFPAGEEGVVPAGRVNLSRQLLHDLIYI